MSQNKQGLFLDFRFRDYILNHLSSSKTQANDTNAKLDAVNTKLNEVNTSLNNIEESQTIQEPSTTIGNIVNSNVLDSVTQITASSNVCKKVAVTSDVTNSGWIKLGGSGVNANSGIILYPAETYEMDVNNTNLIYAIAEFTGSSVSLTYFN